jgi:rhomboid protease GluP
MVELHTAMSHDKSAFGGSTGPLGDDGRPLGEDLLRLVDDDLEDIPTISHDMLHRQRVDLEAGMKVIPPATLALMLSCIVIYLRQVWIGGLADADRVVATGAMDRPKVLEGEYWRLISGGFMHANAEHLIGNMVMLFILGMACEHAFGRGPFLFLYAWACLTGSLAAMVTPTPTVGASGAIFGLAGAVIGLIVVHRREIELRDHRVGIVLLVWAIYTLGMGFFSPIVSNSTHVGGLAGGMILGAILPAAILADRRELSQRVMTRVQAGLAIAALVGSAIFFLPHLR